MVRIVVGITVEAEGVSLDTLTVPEVTVVGIVVGITDEAEGVSLDTLTVLEVTVV